MRSWVSAGGSTEARARSDMGCGTWGWNGRGKMPMVREEKTRAALNTSSPPPASATSTACPPLSTSTQQDEEQLLDLCSRPALSPFVGLGHRRPAPLRVAGPPLHLHHLRERERIRPLHLWMSMSLPSAPVSTTFGEVCKSWIRDNDRCFCFVVASSPLSPTRR